jgi:creatinine amidohydrolase
VIHETPVVLCVDPVEYHGPHLTTRNDALLSEGLARRLVGALQGAGQDWPWRCAGQVGAGADPVIGPGSEPVPFREVRRRVIAACRRLYEDGERRVVLATFHGSPLHNLALEAGARWLRRRGVRVFCPMHLLLRELAGGDLGALLPGQPPEVQLRLPYDVHAGFLETSLALLLAPDTVRGHREVAPCPPLAPRPGPQRLAELAGRLGMPELATELGFVARGLAWYGLRPFPGYSGAPHLASAAAGQALVDAVLPALRDRALAVFLRGEPAPGPILAWMGPLTLWGAVPRTGARVEQEPC